MGLGPNYSDGEWWTRQVVWSYGGAYFTEDGKAAAIDSPEGRAAYEYMASLFQDGLTPPGSIGWDDSGNNKAYLAGQAAMIINVGSVYYALSTIRTMRSCTRILAMP